MGNIKVNKPLFCDMIVSHRCFFQCQMCIDWKTPSDAAILNFSDAKKFVDNISDIVDYKININIMGGEPFMLDWLLPLCDYIYDKGFHAIVSTNAYLIDEEMAKKIRDSGLGVLAISLDGVKAETHDSIRGTKGAYSKVIEALGFLKKYRNSNLHVTILSLILEKNLEELPELVRLAKENSAVNSISFLALVESGLVNRKEGWFRQSEYMRLWPQEYHKVERNIDAIISLKKQGYNIENPFSQLEAFKKYYNDPERFLKETEYCIHDYVVDIDPTGDIFLSGHLLGSIKNDSAIKELWFSEKANKIREYIDLYGCDSSRSCPINFICAFKKDGDQVSDYYGSLAFYYQASGKFDLALLNFNKALKDNPSNAKLHLGAAYNYLKLKDYKAALHEYNQTFELDPDLRNEARVDYENALRCSTELDEKQNNII